MPTMECGHEIPPQNYGAVIPAIIMPSRLVAASVLLRSTKNKAIFRETIIGIENRPTDVME
jgi:hypothetical protein